LTLSPGREPQLAPARLATLYAFASELLYRRHVSPAAFAQARAQFGDQGLVELVGILGYYGLVAMTLNAFEMTFADRDDPFARTS